MANQSPEGDKGEWEKKTLNEASSENSQNCVKKHVLRLREPHEFQAT